MSLFLYFRKSWKPTLVSIACGGTAIGFIYLCYCIFRRVKYSVGDFEIAPDDLLLDLQDIQNSNRQKHSISRSLKSLMSRTSKLSEKQIVPGLSKEVSSFIPYDSDIEEMSIVSSNFKAVGLETLTNVVEHLESLMVKVSKFENLTKTKSFETDNLINDLRRLLENAYGLLQQYRQDYVIKENIQGSLETLTSFDDSCSFFSTTEQLDLSELEVIMRFNLSKPLYHNSLKLLDKGEIHCR